MFNYTVRRAVSGQRAQVIAATPPLRERELARVEALNHAVADALHARGLSKPLALLAAQIGMAAIERATRQWMTDSSHDLRTLLAQSFDDIHTLS